MLLRRPHIIEKAILSEGHEDDNGDWVEGTTTWEPIPCNAVPNGKAEERVFDDGVARIYTYTVYLDSGDFQLGDIVRLFGKEHEVKGFFKNQLISRIWL